MLMPDLREFLSPSQSEPARWPPSTSNRASLTMPLRRRFVGSPHPRGPRFAPPRVPLRSKKHLYLVLRLGARIRRTVRSGRAGVRLGGSYFQLLLLACCVLFHVIPAGGLFDRSTSKIRWTDAHALSTSPAAVRRVITSPSKFVALDSGALSRLGCPAGSWAATYASPLYLMEKAAATTSTAVRDSWASTTATATPVTTTRTRSSSISAFGLAGVRHNTHFTALPAHLADLPAAWRFALYYSNLQGTVACSMVPETDVLITLGKLPTQGPCHDSARTSCNRAERFKAVEDLHWPLGPHSPWRAGPHRARPGPHRHGGSRAAPRSLV